MALFRPRKGTEVLIEALAELLRQCLSVRLRLVGPFEWVDFADFYHRRLWPLKRRVMTTEAQLAFSALRGGPYDRALVERLDAALAKLERDLWA